MRETTKRFWLTPHLWQILLVVALAGTFTASVVAGLGVLESTIVALIAAILASRLRNDWRIQMRGELC